MQPAIQYQSNWLRERLREKGKGVRNDSHFRVIHSRTSRVAGGRGIPAQREHRSANEVTRMSPSQGRREEDQRASQRHRRHSFKGLKSTRPRDHPGNAAAFTYLTERALIPFSPLSTRFTGSVSVFVPPPGTARHLSTFSFASLFSGEGRDQQSA